MPFTITEKNESSFFIKPEDIEKIEYIGNAIGLLKGIFKNPYAAQAAAAILEACQSKNSWVLSFKNANDIKKAYPQGVEALILEGFLERNVKTLPISTTFIKLIFEERPVRVR